MDDAADDRPADPLISPEQQLANLAECAREAVRRLSAFGRSVRDARRLLAYLRQHGFGRRVRSRYQWAPDAWAAVAAVDQLLEKRRLHRLGLLDPIRDDGIPF